MRLIKMVIQKGMFFGAKSDVFNLDLKMRKSPTDAEKATWEILRTFRRSGYPFRRQHPIEFYVADFYCYKLKLVIEADGEIHLKENVRNHDVGRTGEMERLGLKVIRFSNSQPEWE